MIICHRDIDEVGSRKSGVGGFDFINEIVAHDRLMERVNEIAEQICELPQTAMRTDKQAVMTGLGHAMDEALRIETQLAQYAIGSEDNDGRRARICRKTEAEV